MQETGTNSEFHLTVTGIRRDGRRRYNADSKQALAKACLKPGVSLAGMALRHGVNVNLLRKWVDGYRRANDAAAPAVPTARAAGAFVPVLFDDGGNGALAQAMRMPICPPLATPSSATNLDTRQARLRAQMPNGVTVDFECTGRDADLISTVIETLGRCHVSPGR
jgi:transposase